MNENPEQAVETSDAPTPPEKTDGTTVIKLKPYRKPPGMQRRNDRCRCNSGLKFKRCCRLKPTLRQLVKQELVEGATSIEHGDSVSHGRR